MLRSLAEAQLDLAEYQDVFYRIPAEGWDWFHERQRELRGGYTPRTRADIVHDYMEEKARALFADVPGVWLPPLGEQGFSITIRNKWCLQLHKLNDDFTICNNSTRLALEFLDQGGGQLPLTGMPSPVTNLHLGYLLNATETGMASAHIVCPNGTGAYHWEWTLLPEASAGPEPAILPLEPPAKPGSLVRPKPSEKPLERPAKDGTGA